MYKELYRAWKAEKASQKSQSLPDDFYQRIAGYLSSLEEDAAASDPRTLQGRLVIREKELAARLLSELREERLRKIMTASREGPPIEANNLTREEKAFVNRINESLSLFNSEQRDKIERDEQPQEQGELTVVRFLSDVPEIVGVDLKIYGPYKKEDVASLPKQNAQALIKRGVAKQIEVRELAQM